MNGGKHGRRPNQGHGKANDMNRGGRSEHSGGERVVRVTAPYNFVPLSKKVFFPDWASQVSLDVPFPDGICGELSCELTAHTPIYVRNGGKWEREDIMTNKDDAQSFFFVRQGGKPVFMIPGSSLKGMLRSVVEIASFGKMNQVDDHRFSVRDLRNKSLYLDKMRNVRAGWLVHGQENGDWEIIPCDYALIKHDLLGKAEIKHKQSALSKYKIWGEARLRVKFDYRETRLADKVCSLGSGPQDGTLVFTGQPIANDGNGSRKSNEFVFFNEKCDRRIPVPSNLKEDINFIYTEPNTNKPYEEWGYWLDKLADNGRVPVFYQMDGSRLQSFGLTRMYRLPYENSIKQAIAHTGTDHFHTDPDLAETLFGFVDGNRDALKGRVSISAAQAVEGTTKPFDKYVRTVLGAPKPSFYPNYIQQPGACDGKIARDYHTFMDDNCRIQGWKRYPVRLRDLAQAPQGVGDNVDTCLIPLQPEARFTFRLKVHNLKPVELGAIVWALTWGNNCELRHSLGMGKSFGYGQVSIRITGADLRDMADQSIDWLQAMQDFAEHMDTEVHGEWHATAQMEQLLAMANPHIQPQCGELKHLELSQFAKAKTSNSCLPPHVKPTAIPDEQRFGKLPPKRAKVTPVAVVTETWEGVMLRYSPGTRILSAQGPEGKKAEARLEGEAAGLLTEETTARLRKKSIKARVTVQEGGFLYRIVAVEPCC